MAAGKLNITIEQGSTFSRALTIKDGSNVAINLTGKTLRGQIRPSYSSGTYIPFTITVTDAANGLASWVMSAENTAQAVATSDPWVYDIELVHADNTVDRIIQGLATISPEATK